MLPVFDDHELIAAKHQVAVRNRRIRRRRGNEAKDRHRNFWWMRHERPHFQKYEYYYWRKVWTAQSSRRENSIEINRRVRRRVRAALRNRDEIDGREFEQKLPWD